MFIRGSRYVRTGKLPDVRRVRSTLPKQRNLQEITKGFKFQSQPDDCWAVCIYNILHELSERSGLDALKISESRLNRAMGYGRGMGALAIRIDGVAPNLNRLLLPHGYRMQERSEIGLVGIAEILADESASFPVAGVSSAYLRAKKNTARLKIEGEPSEGVDHTVVVLGADAREIVAFDPLEKFSRGGRGGDGLITLGTPTFLEYWGRASVARQWVMYATSIPKRDERSTLKHPRWSVIERDQSGDDK